MLSMCGGRELKQRQQEENELTVLDVEEGNKDSEQSSHGDLTHQLPVAMVGTECQCAFAQVSQTLRRYKQKSVNSGSCTHTTFPQSSLVTGTECLLCCHPPEQDGP